MRSLLKVRAKEAGVTHSQIADVLGVARVTVSRWCRWEHLRGVNLGTMVRLAELLCCGVGDLFDGGDSDGR